MRVAGIMSGTSLDGIDVAIVDITGAGSKLKYMQVAFTCTPYDKYVRARLVRFRDAVPLEWLSQMNFLLGELYAEAILDTCRLHNIPPQTIDLCGMHGQTIYHSGFRKEYARRQIASTLQIGEAAVVAERTGITTISNFRERDIAAGGQGAPLVPFVDHLLFRHPSVHRVALNIGGIANVTILPAGSKREQIVAFDTGPGNMVIDALVKDMTNFEQRFDRDGAIAKAAKVHRDFVMGELQDPYFSLPPPKSCGREEFGQKYVAYLLKSGLSHRDLIATATEISARSIADAIKNAAPRTQEVIASGGGVHNQQIMKRLAKLLRGVRVMTTAEFGMDPDAKEAIAFAVLAYESFAQRPGNLPSATGAEKAVVLGKVTPGRATL